MCGGVINYFPLHCHVEVLDIVVTYSAQQEFSLRMQLTFIILSWRIWLSNLGA